MADDTTPAALAHESPGGYSMTPAWVIKRAYKNVWLYDWLRARYGGLDEVFPGIDTIAETFDISRSTVERAFRQLVKCGVIKIEPRFREDGSQTTNLYVTKFHEPRKESRK